MPISILPPAPAAPIQRHDEDSDDYEDQFDLDGDVAITDASSRRRAKPIITPGEIITDDPQWMRGHGTTISPTHPTTIHSTLFGTLSRTNKLLSITPLRTRYTPSIGDLVVGRIAAVSATGKRWHVDIGAPLLATLPLSAINLPGGVLRKRTAVDELNVRQYFVEGELLVAEVQSLFQDGGAALHARSLRYGKLRNGFFLSVTGAGGEGATAAAGAGPATNTKGVRAAGAMGGGVVRSRRQMFTMATAKGGGPLDVVLGVNGYIWIAKHVEPPAAEARGMSISNMDESVSAGIYSSQNDDMSPETRREISRVAGCVRALVDWGVRVDEDMLGRAYDAALEVEVQDEQEDGSENTGAYVGGEKGRKVVELALDGIV
ncbi:MAG: exosome non-catalytic core subunit rrp4 [Bathelium mastoideum]|nr:MAG: exosome non-catalytic core subunit rrp4 [Bathelium mastoideum]